MKKLTLKEQISAQALTIKKQGSEIKRLTKIVQHSMATAIDLREDVAISRELGEERRIEYNTMVEAFKILAEEIINQN